MLYRIVPAPYKGPMLKIGNYEIRSIVTGRYRLDGGAMFGVVPKVLWQKIEDVDDLNRIAMTMRALLAVDRVNRRVVLVDSGAGDKWPAKEAERYAIQNDPLAIGRALAAHGLSDDDVTDAVITHLHFDHCGGLTSWDAEAGEARTRSRLRFRNARHWVHESQWRHAAHPSDKDQASFLPRDLDAVRESSSLTIVRGEAPSPLDETIRWWVSDGHTPGQLLPLFDDGTTRLLFAGDLIPTSSHLPIPWVMAYDVQPLRTIEEKKRVLERCRADGLMLAFPHDRRMGGARVDFTGKRPTAIPVDLD